MVSSDLYPWSVPKTGNKWVPDQKPALRPNVQDKEVFSVESLEMFVLCLCSALGVAACQEPSLCHL